MTKVLTIETVRETEKDTLQFIQDNKIAFSRVNIAKQQQAKRWPDKYNSWVTSQTRKNLFKDPSTFFRVMHFKPELAGRKFIFRPRGGLLTNDIKQATTEAHRIIIQQLQKFVAAPNISGSPNISTGYYAANLKILLGNKEMQSVSQLDDNVENLPVAITDIAEYATRSESNAFYAAGVGGIFYYAARRIRKKYPQLAIRFTFVTYRNAIFSSYSPVGSSFPTLVIGTSSVVSPKIQKPRQETYNKKTGRRRYYR